MTGEESRAKKKTDAEMRAEVRLQTAKIMKGAAAMRGDREALAKYLGVEPYLVAEWMSGLSEAPYELVNKAIDAMIDGPLDKKEKP